MVLEKTDIHIQNNEIRFLSHATQKSTQMESRFQCKIWTCKTHRRKHGETSWLWFMQSFHENKNKQVELHQMEKLLHRKRNKNRVTSNVWNGRKYLQTTYLIRGSSLKYIRSSIVKQKKNKNIYQNPPNTPMFKNGLRTWIDISPKTCKWLGIWKNT